MIYFESNPSLFYPKISMKMSRFAVSVVLIGALISFSGCTKSEKVTVAPKSPTTHTDEHAGHDHDGHNHTDGHAGHTEFNQNIDFAINYNDGFHSHGNGRFGGHLAVLGGHQYHAEFIPNEETGVVLVILYDGQFKPIKTDAKELTLNMVVDGQPKQFVIPVDFEGSAEKPALYKLTDATLAPLLQDGWTGNAQVSITIDGQPATGPLTPKR